MEFHKEYLLPNHGLTDKAGMLALYMGGPAPTTEAALKAAIDIYDFQDMYAKCLGVSSLSLAGAANASVTLTQSSGRIAMKKCAFDYAFSGAMNGAIPADMKKASIPDKMFLCNVTTPFARATNLGASSFWSNNVAPWLTYEGSNNHAYPTFPGRSGMFDIGLTSCVEFEWDAPRNFGGVLRSGNYGAYSSGASYALVVEAWNGTAWEVVRSSVSISYNVTTVTYVPFTKRIVTNKLRFLVTPYRSTSNTCWPQGLVPLEVTADAPAPVAPPDITWAILLPMMGASFPIQQPALSRLTDLSNPVPLYACTVGGPGESAPAVDIVLSKCRGLSATDLPAVSGLRLMTSNLME